MSTTTTTQNFGSYIDLSNLRTTSFQINHTPTEYILGFQEINAEMQDSSIISLQTDDGFDQGDILDAFNQQ